MASLMALQREGAVGQIGHDKGAERKFVADAGTQNLVGFAWMAKSFMGG
jgi:hypothetical protein